MTSVLFQYYYRVVGKFENHKTRSAGVSVHAQRAATCTAGPERVRYSRARVIRGVTQKRRDYLNNSQTISDIDTTIIKISLEHIHLDIISV